ncbi:MAG: 7-carboxy-7-deazaguanine synthase QueE [bacterium]|nr:7-carboxy-7-deazaguanine synthase QueE [bacterium]
MKANLVEIFSSIQGEGMLVGFRQIFIRFAGCNLRCSYCDTPAAMTVPETWLVPEFDLELPNPVELDQVREVVDRFDPRIHHSVSLTGGEPLLQVEALEELLPSLNQESGVRTDNSEFRIQNSEVRNPHSAFRNPKGGIPFIWKPMAPCQRTSSE